MANESVSITGGENPSSGGWSDILSNLAQSASNAGIKALENNWTKQADTQQAPAAQKTMPNWLPYAAIGGVVLLLVVVLARK